MPDLNITFSAPTYKELRKSIEDWLHTKEDKSVEPLPPTPLEEAIGKTLAPFAAPVVEDVPNGEPVQVAPAASFAEFVATQHDILSEVIVPNLTVEVSEPDDLDIPDCLNRAPVATGVDLSDQPDETVTAELDSSGQPWDERIHAGNKSTNKDGTWRKKRGVDTELVKQVEQGEAGPAPEPKPDTSVPYAQLMQLVSAAVQGGHLAMPQLNELYKNLGVSNVTDLKGSAEKIALASEFIMALMPKPDHSEQGASDVSTK